jgi:hypothetical protein
MSSDSTKNACIFTHLYIYFHFIYGKKLILRLPLRMEHLLLMPLPVHKIEGKCSLDLEQEFIKVK